MNVLKERLILIRCEKTQPCNNRIIGKLKPGSGGELQCPRCKSYYYIDKA